MTCALLGKMMGMYICVQTAGIRLRICFKVHASVVVPIRYQRAMSTAMTAPENSMSVNAAVYQDEDQSLFSSRLILLCNFLPSMGYFFHMCGRQEN